LQRLEFPKENNKLTTIAVSRQNYEVLRTMGKTGDSFNDVITNILNHLRSREE
jgi:predicted CopG family antitoxin